MSRMSLRADQDHHDVRLVGQAERQLAWAGRWLRAPVRPWERIRTGRFRCRGDAAGEDDAWQFVGGPGAVADRRRIAEHDQRQR